LLGGFHIKNPEEEDPPRSILGVVLQVGSSSSGFLIWKPPNRETPLGGGVLSINICRVCLVCCSCLWMCALCLCCSCLWMCALCLCMSCTAVALPRRTYVLYVVRHLSFVACSLPQRLFCAHRVRLSLLLMSLDVSLHVCVRV